MIHTPITDTHAHLCDPVFDQDREDIIARAASRGVTAVICVGETLADGQRNIELARRYPQLLPAAGLSPACFDEEKAGKLIEFIRKNQQLLVAIGEVGLDFWIAKEEETRRIQRKIFTEFILLAKEVDLPLNVHSRSAGRHVVDLLLELNARKVQLHAFDGKARYALPAVEAGYFFSVPPSIVRSPQKQKLIKHLPLSCLLLETDSPVLGPDHDRRNEPANIIGVISAISEIKGIPEQEIIEVASENVSRLYGEM
ncbi:TatD family hydrolase [Thermodesulfobacteriota bacterium]